MKEGDVSITVGDRNFQIELVRDDQFMIVRHMFTKDGKETFDVTDCVEVDTMAHGLVEIRNDDCLRVWFESGNGDRDPEG